MDIAGVRDPEVEEVEESVTERDLEGVKEAESHLERSVVGVRVKETEGLGKADKTLLGEREMKAVLVTDTLPLVDAVTEIE